MAKKRLYVAYGSNLNVQQMRLRCPTAKLVGTGVVEDYELQFKGAANHSYATIAENEGETVPVAVWELQPRDEKFLDRYEGYPRLYKKEWFTLDLNGEKVTAMAYIMGPGHEIAAPYSRYLDTILTGYKHFDFDPEPLLEAARNAERSAS